MKKNEKKVLSNIKMYVIVKKILKKIWGAIKKMDASIQRAILDSNNVLVRRVGHVVFKKHNKSIKVSVLQGGKIVKKEVVHTELINRNSLMHKINDKSFASRLKNDIKVEEENA